MGCSVSSANAIVLIPAVALAAAARESTTRVYMAITLRREHDPPFRARHCWRSWAASRNLPCTGATALCDARRPPWKCSQTTSTAEPRGHRTQTPTVVAADVDDETKWPRQASTLSRSRR